MKYTRTNRNQINSHKVTGSPSACGRDGPLLHDDAKGAEGGDPARQRRAAPNPQGLAPNPVSRGARSEEVKTCTATQRQKRRGRRAQQRNARGKGKERRGSYRRARNPIRCARHLRAASLVNDPSARTSTGATGGAKTAQSSSLAAAASCLLNGRRSAAGREEEAQGREIATLRGYCRNRPRVVTLLCMW